MPETLSGTRPEWGIANAQTGFILNNQDESTSATFLPALNIDGEETGFALFNSIVELTLDGEVPTATPFDVRLGAAVSIGNTIANHVNGSGSVGSGNFYLTSVRRSLPRGAWRPINAVIRGMPNFT
jgi:hypothetical protein